MAKNLIFAVSAKKNFFFVFDGKVQFSGFGENFDFSVLAGLAGKLEISVLKKKLDFSVLRENSISRLLRENLIFRLSWKKKLFDFGDFSVFAKKIRFCRKTQFLSYCRKFYFYGFGGKLNFQFEFNLVLLLLKFTMNF